MKEKVAPSILSADFMRLGEQIRQIEESGTEILHIDIMDGQFVPNISIGFPVLKSIRPCTKMMLDVHLMVQNPEHLIDLAVEAGADSITVHQEACTHLKKTICQIKEKSLKAGVALNPETSLQTLEYVARDVDMVLLMTVNPGFGGQAFITEMLGKIRNCQELFDRKGCRPLIELDGGISTDNAGECMKAGANILVAGSSVFRGNIQENIKKFQQVFDSIM